MTEQAANNNQGAKAIDVSRVVRHLNANFKAATQKLGGGRKNERGTELYKLQCDFAYMIDEIERGPVYLMPKIISDANELIAAILIKAKAKETDKK